MRKVILLKGLPASGKTTWAKEQLDKNSGTYKRVNKDDLRLMLDNSHWTGHNEDFVLQLRDMIIVEALNDGKSVIVDDTNFEERHEARIKELIHGYNTSKMATVQFEVKFFNVPIDECIERDRFRQNPVGEKIIRDMYNKYLRKEDVIPKIAHDPTLPDAIICDLDGTLALPNGRNPYDASTCMDDLLNEPIARILGMASFASNEDDKGIKPKKIILVSGREDKYRQETGNWLAAKEIEFESLFMRKTGDWRKDSVIKKEIYEKEIRGKYNVLFVLDDRNAVVSMWRRELGFTCLQVAVGDF